MAYSFTVLLDTVYDSKHSPMSIMGALWWKTCVLQGNFCPAQSKTPGHFKSTSFLKQLSRLCFPDFQAYSKWWEKKPHARLCLKQLQTASGAGFQKGERKVVTKKIELKIVLWLYGMHQCFMYIMGKKSWRADGNMKWRWFWVPENVFL